MHEPRAAAQPPSATILCVVCREGTSAILYATLLPGMLMLMLDAHARSHTLAARVTKQGSMHDTESVCQSLSAMTVRQRRG